MSVCFRLSNASTRHGQTDLVVAVDEDLGRELSRIANAPWLIVASDFDGTLATLIHDPKDVDIHPENADALRRLAQHPRTVAAVVSGRSYTDLHRRVGHIEGVRVVGAHGREIDGPIQLTGDELALLREIENQMRAMASAVAGVIVEPKDNGIAMHTQKGEATEVEGLIKALAAELVEPNELYVQTGKHLFEIALHAPDKGEAVRVFRQELGSRGVAAQDCAAIFIGDDLTDERGFAALGPGDLGIKVGVGETGASHRVQGLAEVTAVLTSLAEQRGQVG
jgi:trehalose 6-phosphate phosphatase